MKTENLTMNEAIDALNAGYKLTHPGIENIGKYIINDPSFDGPARIHTDKWCDPLVPQRDVYGRKFVIGLKAANHENVLNVCWIYVQWKIGKPEKDFGKYETGWSIINEPIND